MSELKAKHIVDVYDSYNKNPFGERSQVYLKSEADKVIADLEESHKMEVEQLLIEIVKLKARIADLEALNHDLCERVTENDEIRLHWEEIEQTRDENERMKARIAELEEERRWRKCSEELPEDGAEVLATDGEEIWLCHKDTVCDGSPWFQPDGLPHIEGVTHWMPQPSAPKEEK